MDERVGDLAVGAFEDVANSLPRNPHLQGHVGLVQTIEISQPERFKFVRGERHLIKRMQGHADRLEIDRYRLAVDATLFGRAGHESEIIGKSQLCRKAKTMERWETPCKAGICARMPVSTMVVRADMKKILVMAALMLAIPVSWGKTFLIDVRTPAEFSAGHIEGAINIEYQGIGQKIAESGAARDDEVILYCHSGRRAGIARDTLLKAGFVNVQNYGGVEEARQRLITRPHTQP